MCKIGQLTLLFGTQNPAQPLRFFLPTAEGAAELDHHVGVGQVDRKIAHFGDDQTAQFTCTETVVKLAAFACRRIPGDQGKPVAFLQPPQLLQVHPDDQHLVIFVLVQQLVQHPVLGRAGGCNAIFVAGIGQRILHAQLRVQQNAHLDTLRRRNPPLPLQNLPRHIILFRADQRKDLALPAILTHQGGGQPQPTPRLQLGCNAEDRCRQQVHFVVDDQPPSCATQRSQNVGIRRADCPPDPCPACDR